MIDILRRIRLIGTVPPVVGERRRGWACHGLWYAREGQPSWAGLCRKRIWLRDDSSRIPCLPVVREWYVIGTPELVEILVPLTLRTMMQATPFMITRSTGWPSAGRRKLHPSFAHDDHLPERFDSNVPRMPFSYLTLAVSTFACHVVCQRQ